jgi:hypothetical protein
MVKLHALSITRWKHDDAHIKEPVHLCFAVDLSQLSFFQVSPGQYRLSQTAFPHQHYCLSVHPVPFHVFFEHTAATILTVVCILCCLWDFRNSEEQSRRSQVSQDLYGVDLPACNKEHDIHPNLECKLSMKINLPRTFGTVSAYIHIILAPPIGHQSLDRMRLC